jgi:hypothetical protein
MTGRRLFPAALIAAVVIIAALWGMQREADRRLREQTDSSRQLLGRVAVLEVDNLRLSNILVRADTPLADVQLAELAKLRDEVQRLRHRTNDIQVLQAELLRLRAKLASIGSNALPDVPPEDIYPRESWEFAGYDTPEATLESVTWAISEGNEDAYMAGLSPELRDQMQSQLGGGSFAEAAPLEMSDTTGFRIVGRETISDNQVVYTVHMDGANDEADMVLQYANGGWMVVGEGKRGR